MQRKGSFTRALTELIGPVATQALIDAFPGKRLYIPAPEHLTPDHPIAVAIGLGPAQTLGQHYGGSRPLIPMGADHHRHSRDQQIVEAHQAGARIPELVAQFRLSPRRLSTIVAKGNPSADCAS